MHQPDVKSRSSLIRYAWLSIAAAVVTIALKGLAYVLTGSVGLLSDAVESLVNLVGANVALAMLTVASRPPDEDHHYGHGKAEYFERRRGHADSTGCDQHCHRCGESSHQPHTLGTDGGRPGGFCRRVDGQSWRGAVLLSVGKKYESITLEADARHLMTDVWTSVGVIGGLVAVTLTGWQRLDPVVAIAVALNIVWSGYSLVRRSVLGLLDTALPTSERQTIATILEKYEKRG